MSSLIRVQELGWGWIIVFGMVLVQSPARWDTPGVWRVKVISTSGAKGAKGGKSAFRVQWELEPRGGAHPVGAELETQPLPEMQPYPPLTRREWEEPSSPALLFSVGASHWVKPNWKSENQGAPGGSFSLHKAERRRARNGLQEATGNNLYLDCLPNWTSHSCRDYL